MIAAGFLVFAAGLGLSAVQTKATDFDEMFWPQLIRGWAIMFCILAPTQLALGQLAREAIADASGLFNLMRNLGGAIGIAVIDTVIYNRAPEHARTLVDRLAAGDLDVVKTLGVAPDVVGLALFDPGKRAMLAALVDKVAFVEATNDAWSLVAVTTLAALAVVPFARGTLRAGSIVLLSAHENEPTCAHFSGPTECAGMSNGVSCFEQSTRLG